MKNRYRGRLLLSTCMTGAALSLAMSAHAQTSESTWKPRADVDAETGKRGGQVSIELFAPLAQNDSNLLFVTGRIGDDDRLDRNGSVTIGGRGRVGDDIAIGVNAGVDLYRSPTTGKSQTAASFGIEAFTSVFDARLNYRAAVSDRRRIGFGDPNASPLGVLSVENNRLVETKAGYQIFEIPLSGVNGEVGARAFLTKNLSLRGSLGGFDYHDDAAERGYRGTRSGIELDIDDPLGEGSRFSFGAKLQDDNRFGTQVRATARLSIPFGGTSTRDRSTASRLERQMGDRLRRDYVTEAGTRYTDLTSTSFAIDNRTGQAFGGIYYTNGAATAAAAGTAAAPTTINDAAARAGANGVVVALGGAGNIATAGVTLGANAYLVGGASSVDVRRSNGTVTQFGFGGTNGTITGTSAAGAAVTLGQGSVVRDVTIRGAGTGIAATGVGGFALDRVIIENTGGAGLSLTNTLGPVVVDGLTVRGAAGAGVLINGGSNITLRNSTIGGGAGAIDINDAGAALTTSLSNLTLSATGGTVLDIDGSGPGTVTVAGLSGVTIAGGNGETGGFAARYVDFDASTAAGVQAVNAGTMRVGTAAARVNGTGVSLTEVTGGLSFASLDVANNAGTGLIVRNTKSGDFTLTTLGGGVNTTAGTALDLDPLFINLTFSSVSSVGATGAGVILSHVTGAGTGGNALTIGSLTITNAALQGLFITGGSTGLVTIGGGSITNSGGASVQVGQSGIAGSGGTIGLNFGASIADNSAGPLVSLFNFGGAIRFTGTITGAGPIVATNGAAGSSVGFTGATTLTGASSPSIALTNLLGSFNFSGPLTIANPMGDGIVIGTVSGGVTFGDVDITGLGGGTGVDLTGALGNITFGTLDISGTGVAGSTGIDLTGATNSGAMAITGPSTIQSVDIGIDLTNGAITGSFRFGDGMSGDGLESTITANTPIVTTGLDTTRGTYDFSDVQLNGDTSALTGGSFTAYYVLAGAVGSGASSSDPGSLAGAEASGAQYIVLLNNPSGGHDVIDAIAAGGSFDLTSGQTMVSFLYTDFFSVTGATVPSNLSVSGVGDTGITNPYAGSGAAILTTSSPLGAATVNLASGARLDGVIVQNGGLGGGFGVAGTGVSNVTITNSNISGNGGAISLTDGGAAASATLSNLNLSASGGTALVLDGSGAGTLTVSGTGVSIAATGSAAAANVSDVTIGSLELGAISTAASAGAAVRFDNIAGGSLTTGGITVGGTNAGAGLTISNSAATVTTGAVSVTGSAGDAVLITGNSGPISIGTLALAGSGGAGLRVGNTSGSITVSGGSIANSAGGAVVVDGVGATGSLTVGALSTSGGAGGAIRLSDVDGSARFTGTTTIASSAGILLGAGSAGTIVFGDVDITGLAANTTGVDARAASGTVTFNTLDITGASATGTRGVDLTGATFAGSLTTAQSGTIIGVGIGVDLTNAAITGSFRYGDGSNVDADGAASIINAVTPIAVGGLNTGIGSYNFADVALTGDVTALSSTVTVFFVEEGKTGTGTKSDPGSLAAAEAANAQVIILLNNPAGGQDTLDAGPLASFNLDPGQRLLGFLNGDTQTIGGGSPANLVLYGITQGVVTNPYAGSGAAILTSTAGTPTVTLANNALIDGVIIAGAGIGVFGSGASGVAITNSQISGATGAIRLVDGGLAASATLTNLTLSASGGTVLDLAGTGGGSLTLQGSGLGLTATGAARAIAADRVTLGGNLAFGTVSTQVAGGAGVSLANIGGAGALSFGSIGIGGTTAGSGVYLSGNSAAIALGSVTAANTASHAIEIVGNAGNVSTGTYAISGAAGSGIAIDGMPGAFTAAGGTIANTGASGIALTDIDGSASFTGGVTISNPGTSGILLGAGSAGTIAFTDTDITGLAANTTGVDARTASGTVTFATLDITGATATGTRGIDLRGATFAGSLATTDSGTITGVGTGVDLTNAAITGSFRYGDGSNTDADGAESYINATTPLMVSGLNAGVGAYDFRDVNLVGDVSGLSTSATLFWVQAGASGAGTRSDPGSLAAAQASSANIIVLLNDPNAGNDTIDANAPVFGSGGTFTMDMGQQLLGFLNGDTIVVPGGAPANVALFGIATGSVTNPFAGSGAPTLTTTAVAVNTVTIANNGVIDGVIIANPGGAGVGGVGVSNATIRNSQISGANRAIDLSDGGNAASVALSNLRLWSSNNSVGLAAYVAGAGSMTVTQLSNVKIEGGHGEQGATYFQGANFDSDLATAGDQTVDASLQIGSAATRIIGEGLNLTNATGLLNLTALSIYNSGAAGLTGNTSGLTLTSAAGTVDTLDGDTVSITNASIDLVLDAVTHSGLGNGITLLDVSGVGTGGRAADVGTLSFNSGGTAISIGGTGTNTYSFGAASAISGTTGTAISLASSAGALDFSYAGSVTQAANAALLNVNGHSGTVTFGPDSRLSATSGTGLQFSDADGAYAFNGTTTLNGGDAGIDILAGSSGTFTFGANTSITSPTGTAINLAASNASLTYSGNVTQANNAALLTVATHAAGTLTFDTGTLSATSGTGLQFNDADGTYAFNGTTTLNGGDAGIDILAGSSGTFTFGANTSITSPTGAAINLAASNASLTYSGSVTQANNAALLAVATHAAGTLNLSAATLSASGGSGLSFDDADGVYQFGSFALSGGAGVRILNGSAGNYTFGDVDITGLATGTAVDLRGVTGNVTFNTLDIAATSAAGTVGIDLTGNTTAGDVIVNESSNIGGVGVGVDLTNAALTGNFRYGDGSNVDADGAASNITATTPLVLAGLSGATGTYNFADVNLNGDTTSLSVAAYFVLQGATGSGSRNDPGTLAGAEASAATYIVLLNDPTGGDDLLDATDAGGSLDLDGGQFLYAFRDVDSFAVGGGAPANVTLYNVQTGVISNPFAGSGAPILTAGGTAPTIVLNGSNVLDGLRITNSGTGAGVSGNGAGNVTIRNSTISGGAAGAINLADGGVNTIASFSNLTLAAAGGTILNLNGSGAGTMTVASLSNLTVNHTTETGGFVFTDVTFDGDSGAPGLQALNAGALTLGTSGARISGNALSLANVTGTLNFTNLNIANNAGTGLLVANSKTNNFTLGTTGGTIDTTSGTAVDLDPLTVNMVLDAVNATGGAYGIRLDTVEGSFAVSGAVNLTNASVAGIQIANNSAQTVPLVASFQGAVAIATTGTATGVSLLNNTGATVNFTGGLGINSSRTGISASGGGTLNITGATNSVTGSITNALYLNGITLGASGVALGQITAGSGATGIYVSNVALTGGLNVGGLTVTGSGTGALFDNLTGAGGVTLTGAIDLDSTSGLAFSGSLGTIDIANTTGSSLTIDGAATAISLASLSSGTINIASAAGSASIGATSTPTTAAIAATAGTGGTLNYGGTIATTVGKVLSVTGNDASTINLSGAITSTTALAAFDFVNADGAYTISGSVAHTGGAGIAVAAASSGAITFSNATKSFNTGSAAAISMVGTGSLTLSGGGLDIDTTSGAGFAANGGGTVRVLGANNSITTTTGTALNLNGVVAGTGGINFADVSVNGAASGIVLAGVTSSGGGGLGLGTVSLQGITSRGIDINTSLAAALAVTDLDIGLNSTSAVAFDLNGAALSAAITAGDFDVTNAAGAGTSIAVDLRDTTGGQIVRLGDPLAGGASTSVSGVGTGVFLNAATNATFTYGDGETATDTGSTISAITAINASAAPAAGTYDSAM